MFGKKKEAKKEHGPRSNRRLEQFGIYGLLDNLDNIGEPMSDSDMDDADLEEELAALAIDQPRRQAPKRPPKPEINLDSMIEESLKDIPSDQESSCDENDPDLLDELKMITGDAVEAPIDSADHTNDVVNELTKTLEERLLMYKKAEKKAKADNESSRARRFNRGIKTLERLLSSCKVGNEIDQSEIPPALPASALKDSASIPSTSADEGGEEEEKPSSEEAVDPPTETITEATPGEDSEGPAESPSESTEKPVSVTIDETALNTLKNRQKEYKMAALAWKKSGNLNEALKLMKITKQFDTVLASVEQGETVDLSDMPGAPSYPSETSASFEPPDEGKEESSNQRSADAEPNLSVAGAQGSGVTESLESALKERLEIYRRSKTVAEAEGNSSKVRRYNRICKQFEDALKLHSKGKAVPIDELPTPPGFPPLSSIGGSVASKPITPGASALEEPKATEPSSEPSPKPSTPAATPRASTEKRKKLTSRVDRQIEILEKRKSELKMAALRAKKDGNIDLARDYLRQAKGIDPLLEASLAGLPVDMNSIPLSPEARRQLDEARADSPNATNDDGFTSISSIDCLEEASGTDQEIYDNLEEQLKKQIKWCLSTRDHCKNLGDVSSYNKWERLALDYKKDLDMLRVNKRNDLPPPKHHYEIKIYSLVQSCTDLADADIEISIIRGTNYPKEVDSYVIFEFPWPNDAPVSNRTPTIRGTNNPEYKATYPLSGIIDRKSRQCLRIFKRHSLKCQIWSKGCSLNPLLCCTHPRGFLRADSLVGTVNIKLQPLETKCILHDSFPLMEGRKAVGGKLEVKMRLRNPISTKQIEQNKDKWLSIDH